MGKEILKRSSSKAVRTKKKRVNSLPNLQSELLEIIKVKDGNHLSGDDTQGYEIDYGLASL